MLPLNRRAGLAQEEVPEKVVPAGRCGRRGWRTPVSDFCTHPHGAHKVVRQGGGQHKNSGWASHARCVRTGRVNDARVTVHEQRTTSRRRLRANERRDMHQEQAPPKIEEGKETRPELKRNDLAPATKSAQICPCPNKAWPPIVSRAVLPPTEPWPRVRNERSHEEPDEASCRIQDHDT